MMLVVYTEMMQLACLTDGCAGWLLVVSGKTSLLVVHRKESVGCLAEEVSFGCPGEKGVYL